uniref:NOP9 nucleolar protein n=1 Tax=Latimeria chalumnae TaxID=7897 RepID=H3AQ14_LATCH
GDKKLKKRKKREEGDGASDMKTPEAAPEGISGETERDREGATVTRGPERKGRRGAKDSQRPGLDPKSVGYFRRVSEMLEKGFESQEEKHLFISNVFGEVRGNEVAVSTDATGSLVLEKLLESASRLQLCQLLSVLSHRLGDVCCHRCGGHVLETALLQIPRFREAKECGTLEAAVVQLCTRVKERFLDYAQDTHSSFVLRTLIQVLGGFVTHLGNQTNRKSSRTLNSAKHSGKVSQVTEFEVPGSFSEELQGLISCVQENIKVFVTSGVASPVFQVALEVLHRKLPPVCNQLCRSLLDYLALRNPSAECSPLLMFLKDQTGSRLLEKVIEVADRKLFKKLYKSHFREELVPLSLHEIANFAVQRLLAAVPTAKLFRKLFDELCPGLEAVLARGHMGVITQLAAACAKHKAREDELLRTLMEAFHCADPDSRQIACVSLFACLLTYEVYYSLGEEQSTSEHQCCQPSTERRLRDVSFHGSLLLQHLLHFQDPSAVLLSLAAMMEDDLVTLACDQAGSHVFDALLSSGSVPEKRRKKILGKLKGQYVKMACNKHGSRVLDQIWNAATIGVKQNIAEELTARESELRSDPFGHHIVRNFALAHFLKRRQDWEEHQAAEIKRRKMFADILED